MCTLEDGFVAAQLNGGGIKNGHIIRYPSYGGTQEKMKQKKKPVMSIGNGATAFSEVWLQSRVVLVPLGHCRETSRVPRLNQQPSIMQGYCRERITFVFRTPPPSHHHHHPTPTHPTHAQSRTPSLLTELFESELKAFLKIKLNFQWRNVKTGHLEGGRILL